MMPILLPGGMSYGYSSDSQTPFPAAPFPQRWQARGVLYPRVQRVGPDHFGIVCFDCPKARSKFLLADFYGRLIPPTAVAHHRPDLDPAVVPVRKAFAAHQLQDGL